MAAAMGGERRLGRRLLALAYCLPRVLVRPESLVHGCPQGAGGRPLAEGDLGDELRLHEDGLLRWLAALERAVVPAQRLEDPGEPVELCVAEAGADAPGVAEPSSFAAFLVVTDEEGAERSRAAALPREPAADDELLAAEVLHLQPGACPAPGQVAAVKPLGDEPLEGALLREAEQRRALAAVIARRLPVRALQLQLGEALPPLGVWEVEQRTAVEVEQVED